MKKVLITGYNGFIGKNLIEGLGRINGIHIETFGRTNSIEELHSSLKEVDFIYHLAGVNRYNKEIELKTGNIESIKNIVDFLYKTNKKVPIVITSSIQAELNNPYGLSKKNAEDILIEYSKKLNAPIYIYRLPNVFGKWSKPNYNSVVATFCYNISHNLDVWISDDNKKLELVYIDDVVNEFVNLLSDKHEKANFIFRKIEPTYEITLDELVKKIYQLKQIRDTLIIPDLSDNFMKHLYSTYLSYLDKGSFSYEVDLKIDNRGSLFEFIRSKHIGQIFISKSNEKVIRGNHYHNSKIEKFCIIQGEAIIKLRNIFEDEVISYSVSGENIQIIDIPPGYTHSIKNITDGELIVVFWASEIFDPQSSDTYYCEV